MKTIGSRLKTIRKNYKLSVADVAVKTGLAKSNLSRIENDEHDPSAASLKALAKFYGISADWILFGTEASEGEKIILLNGSDEGEDRLVDRKFRLILGYLSKIWLESDQNMRGWIIIQLSNAFPGLKNYLEQK
jgi:transcriptional regulator with XRE-family HTH domain